MGVIIETPQLSMEITLVPIESLFIHEETISKELEKLKRDLIAAQVLKHPMIVDSSTLVVLDGMHRVAALKSLGCQLAAVCLVDYQNPAIELLAWHREFAGNINFSEFESTLSIKGPFNLILTSVDKAFENVKNRKADVALANGNSAHLLNFPNISSIKAVYDEISNIEILARDMGYDIFYSTEPDAIESIHSSIRPVLIVPSLTKEEVIEWALKNEVFTHKTTRHVVPARPLYVNVPLPWLKQSNLDKANQKLKKHLENKRIIEKETGAIINGRR
ncbi:MAG: ParB N-terminal domain-containing protein, partial [Candidatus Hermodarchaeia archaeon]